MKTRIRAGASASLLILAVSIVAFGGSPTALATQDQAVIAGQTNTEDQTTALRNTNFSVDCSIPFLGATAVMGCGGTGVEGRGSVIGVIGDGPTYGVSGTTKTGTGVYGSNSGSTGIGVKGETGGTGSAVYGNATANGVGVFGDTTNGIGVEAKSTNGPALLVQGKAQFSRSGIAYVPAPGNRYKVNLAGTNAQTMVLATVQQGGGYFVKSVVPTSGSFTIFINKDVQSNHVVKVAYFVLN